jgi:hypothetical protein
MTCSQNWLVSIVKEGKQILEDLEADGNCNIPEKDLVHDVRRSRRLE